MLSISANARCSYFETVRFQSCLIVVIRWRARRALLANCRPHRGDSLLVSLPGLWRRCLLMSGSKCSCGCRQGHCLRGGAGGVVGSETQANIRAAITRMLTRGVLDVRYRSDEDICGKTAAIGLDVAVILAVIRWSDDLENLFPLPVSPIENAFTLAAG